MRTVHLWVAALALAGCSSAPTPGDTASSGASSSGSQSASASSGASAGGGSGTAATSGGSGGQGGGGGEGGVGGSGATSCMVDGQPYEKGSLDPDNPCHMCDPSASATAWTDAPDGKGCGPGSLCTKGACSVAQPPACDVNVPGDYASPQAAVTALRAAGQKATVCIADGTYGGLTLDYGTAELTLVGSSASRVILDGSVKAPDYLGSSALVRLQGVTITQGVDSSESITLEACVIKAPPGGNAVVIGQPNFYPGNFATTVKIDSCDISAPTGMAVSVGFGSASCAGATPLYTTITNNYLHGSKYGIRVYVGAQCGEGGLSVLHTTFIDNETAIFIMGQYAFPSTIFAANVIMGATTAISSERNAVANGKTIDDFHHNALFGNTTNYGGLAAPGMGYVTKDPQLTSAVPPAPGPGSPLIAAGDPALVPAVDYFGIGRNGRADIGAVQGP